MRRQEIALSGGPANLRLGLSYIDIAAIPDVPSLPKRRQVTASVSTTLTHYWSLALTGTRDFAQGQETLNSGIALTYRDECIAFVTSLTQSGISTGDVHPGTSLLFTIVFKNLGEIGSRIASFGGGGS
jgi:LPS-assembly protein